MNPAAKVANSAIQKYNPEPPLYEMAGWMYEIAAAAKKRSGSLAGNRSSRATSRTRTGDLRITNALLYQL
ncbi:MAG: hypothetical protein J6T56_09045, partial [Bacteroidales bacterium]|nr:hypothetical protein [Bacteroidales bacterium]